MYTPQHAEGAAFIWSLSDEALLRAANELYDHSPAPLPVDFGLAVAWLTDELIRRTPGLDAEIDRVIAEGFTGHFGGIVCEAYSRVQGR